MRLTDNAISEAQQPMRGGRRWSFRQQRWILYCFDVVLVVGSLCEKKQPSNILTAKRSNI